MTIHTIPIIIMGMIYYAASVNGDPIAYIGESQIVGQKVRHLGLEVNQYLGIPYAEPPVGNLRFMRTKPVGSLPKVLMAVHQPPACHQYTKNPFLWYINSTEKSEDCLYLNIWTPTDASPKNTKAVMYWIHGGGFRYGSIRDELYSGIPLAALGHIVVVTVNYRLGPFGFLTSNTGDAPGNAGLWDILEGLIWVNQNIRAFGGDASKITIAGESAGSVAVTLLSVSPLSKGLFTRQTIQSGSSATLRFDRINDRNIRFAQDLATLVGCANETSTINDRPSEVTQCLKDVDAFTLSRMDSLINPHSTNDFRPQFGDEIIPTNPRLAIANGEFHCTQLLVGVTKDEGSAFLTIGNPDVFGLFGEKDHQLNKTTGRDMIKKQFSTFRHPDALTNHYLPDELPENAYKTIRHEVYTSMGDSYTLCPVVYTAEACAEKNSSVYFYFWRHRPSITPWGPWMGVAHFSEVQFVFGRPLLNPQRYRPEEGQLSYEVVQTWSSFVKYGQPSSVWPLYRKDFPIFKYIDSNRTQNCGMGPHHKNCNILRTDFGF